MILVSQSVCLVLRSVALSTQHSFSLHHWLVQYTSYGQLKHFPRFSFINQFQSQIMAPMIEDGNYVFLNNWGGTFHLSNDDDFQSDCNRLVRHHGTVRLEMYLIVIMTLIDHVQWPATKYLNSLLQTKIRKIFLHAIRKYLIWDSREVNTDRSMIKIILWLVV